MKNNTIKAISGLLKASPTLLLVSMILAFLIAGTIQLFYYGTDVFGEKLYNIYVGYALALAVAVFIQLARFAFGLAGAYEFARGQVWKGVFGLLFSLGFTIWESIETVNIAVHWAKGDLLLLNAYSLIFQLVIWAGFILEIRLLISLKNELNAFDQRKTKTNKKKKSKKKGKSKNSNKREVTKEKEVFKTPPMPSTPLATLSPPIPFSLNGKEKLSDLDVIEKK